MKRAGVVAAFVACLFVTVGFSSPAPTHPVYVVNESTLVSNEQIRDALPAFQAQIDEDMHAWDVSGQLILTTEAPEGAWQILVTDNPNCFFCGGYHEYVEGTVRAEVAATKNREWQLAFSHELVEMLVDPFISGDGDGGRLVLDGNRAWLVEIADPTEDKSFAYERDGVLLSDFVLPAWYQHGSQGPWDFTGDCRHARHVLDGGYGWYILAGRWVSL